MKRYEYMDVWFKGPHGATPPAEVVVARLNELGADGWRPAFGNFSILMREVPERESKPFWPLVKGKPAGTEVA